MTFDKHEITRRRSGDHDTSIEGSRRVTSSAETVRARLHAAFAAAGATGLTDEQAAERSGLLDTCYWKRCNELRQDGAIRATDRTRPGRKRVKRIVSVIG